MKDKLLKEPPAMIEWHRLFGLTLKDFFSDTGYEVELEKDLSVKQQFLDVVIIEKEDGKLPEELPDGLENLASHNLMTYKSHQQSLDEWTLDELIGHYVNYRKQISLSDGNLLPPEDFQLYAVSTRYPQKLAEKSELIRVSEGVYDIVWGSRRVRTVVLSRVPETDRNAIWQLFSAIPEHVRYGAAHYRWKTKTSTVMNCIFGKYGTEGVIMPYTFEDFERDYAWHCLHSLTPEELIKGLSADEKLRNMMEDAMLGTTPADKIIKRIPKEEMLKAIMADGIFESIPADEVLKHIPKHEVEKYLTKLNSEKS